MQSLVLRSSLVESATPDVKLEIARYMLLVFEKREELSALQSEFRQFKTRYAQIVGRPMAELAEIEAAIRMAEEKSLGIENETTEDAHESNEAAHDFYRASPQRNSLRNLFRRVARSFHPDHARDVEESARRHQIMVEAGRALEDGDEESLYALLGGTQMRAACVETSPEDEQNLTRKLFKLQEELNTLEFGVTRLKRERLYVLMRSCEAASAQGRDLLAEMRRDAERKILKARRRLEHLS